MPTVRLTERHVSSAKAAPGERLELFDQTMAGLVLRVSETGRKSWVVRYRARDGRQPRLTLGTYPALGLADARLQAGDIIQAALKGEDPAAEKRRAKTLALKQPIKTLSDLSDAYFKACRNGDYRARKRAKAESTLKQEEWVFDKYLAETLGGERLEDIDADFIRAAMRKVIAAGAPSQANKCRSVLSQLFNYAIAEERVATNPIARVQKLNDDSVRDRVLKDAELARVWAGLLQPSVLRMTERGVERPVQVGRPVAIALQLATLLLQRRSEISGMTMDELDLEQAVWVIGRDRTKNRREHVVPLPPLAITLIQEARQLALEGGEKTPFVFPSPRDRERPIGGGALTHALGDVYRGVGIENATVHDLRRTGATLLTSERGGQRRFVVSKLLNHTAQEGAAVTGIYDRHEYLPEKRKALEAWERLLLQIVSRKAASASAAA